MQRGWKLYFNENFRGNAVHVAEQMFKKEFEHLIGGPYSCPKERIWREAPGKERRNHKKESMRQADFAKIRQIVSGIFAKKQLRYPPSTIRDLGWDKKFKDD